MLPKYTWDLPSIVIVDAVTPISEVLSYEKARALDPGKHGISVVMGFRPLSVKPGSTIYPVGEFQCHEIRGCGYRHLTG